MSIDELLERRAERGVPRGAARVWADSHGAEPSVESSGKRTSVTLFRLAVAVWILGFVAVGIFRSTSPQSNDAASGHSTQVSGDGSPDVVESDEPLPAPLLIDGGSLKRDRGGVSRPFDPDFDGDDLLDDLFPRSQTTPEVAELSPEQLTMVIFARPTEPFDGPIVGVELLDGGGFRPWGANVDDAALTDLTQQLERTNGEWSMAERSGLVEVARMEGDQFDSLRFGWQFDFQLGGNEEVTIQAETSRDDRVVDEWLWVARLAGQSQTNVAVRSIEVLGQDGIVIDRADGAGDSGVVWRSDGFVYRMTASTVEDNTAYGRDSTEDIDRLRIVERGEWLDAIAASSQTSIAQWGIGFAGLVIFVGSALSTVWFLVRRSFPPAALAGATVVAWVYLVASPIYWGTVALSAFGLGLAWLLHTRGRRATAGSTISG